MMGQENVQEEEKKNMICLRAYHIQSYDMLESKDSEKYLSSSDNIMQCCWFDV